MIETLTAEASQAKVKWFAVTSGATMGPDTLRQDEKPTYPAPRWYSPSIPREIEPTINLETVQLPEWLLMIASLKSEETTANRGLLLISDVESLVRVRLTSHLEAAFGQGRRSTARSLLKHATGWVGGDLAERLAEVYEMRSEASF